LPSPETLGELWAGHIYGTNTGKIFLEISGSNENLVGTLRLADDQFGLAILEVTGVFSEGVLKLGGHVTEGPEGVAFGEVEATAKLQPNGTLSGEWKSTLGTGGAFQLFPHLGTRESALQPTGPEQVYTTTRDLGVLRLYKDDILGLIATLKSKFPTSKVVVSHTQRGADLAQYADEFEAGVESVDRLHWIKLNVLAVDSPNTPRIVTIDLGPQYNRVVTQGADESWVLGEAEVISSSLRRREQKLSTRIGKYGVNLNLLIALAVLIVLPELPLLQRAGFAALALLFLLIAAAAQRAWIPNFVAELNEPTPSPLARAWPSILSWIISMTAGLAAAIVYGLLHTNA
jgi:hypothetical protein